MVSLADSYCVDIIEFEGTICVSPQSGSWLVRSDRSLNYVMEVLSSVLTSTVLYVVLTYTYLDLQYTVQYEPATQPVLRFELLCINS